VDVKEGAREVAGRRNGEKTTRIHVYQMDIREFVVPIPADSRSGHQIQGVRADIKRDVSGKVGLGLGEEPPE